MTVEHIQDASLDWRDLSKLGMQRRRGDCIEPTKNTPTWVVAYLDNIRSPSRKWPFSYARALQTQKFARVVIENDPHLALQLKIAHNTKDT
jgi:hypothetical protein